MGLDPLPLSSMLPRLGFGNEVAKLDVDDILFGPSGILVTEFEDHSPARNSVNLDRVI
jgi:hypothetical protein